MRKILLSAAVCLLSLHGSAQHSRSVNRTTRPGTVHAAKPTALGDTVVMTNIPGTATSRVLYNRGVADSGFTSGMNVYNDMGFAERYSFSAADSTVNVIGVMTQFGGTVSNSTGRSVTLRIWNQGAQRYIAPSLYYAGFPGDGMDSLTVPANQLGIGATADTLKTFFFPAGTGLLSGPFFAGYTIHYNFASAAGDTIALLTSQDGTRNTNPYTLRYNTGTAGDTTSVDTLINVQNATLWNNNVWHDNYTDNDSLYNNLAIYPIIMPGAGTAVQVVSKDLSVNGVYPNPADGSATVAFSVTGTGAVQLLLTDMTGRTVYAREIPVTKGAYTPALPTSSLPTGNYLCLIRSGSHNGVAVKLSVVH